MENKIFKYGDIFYANLPVKDNSCVQGGTRPVVVISNDMNNKHSKFLSVVTVTTSKSKSHLPTHVAISGCGLHEESIALCEQIMSIDKFLVSNKIGNINNTEYVDKIKEAVKIQLNLSV